MGKQAPGRSAMSQQDLLQRDQNGQAVALEGHRFGGSVCGGVAPCRGVGQGSPRPHDHGVGDGRDDVDRPYTTRAGWAS